MPPFAKGPCCSLRTSPRKDPAFGGLGTEHWGQPDEKENVIISSPFKRNPNRAIYTLHKLTCGLVHVTNSPSQFASSPTTWDQGQSCGWTRRFEWSRQQSRRPNRRTLTWTPGNNQNVNEIIYKLKEDHHFVTLSTAHINHSVPKNTHVWWWPSSAQNVHSSESPNNWSNLNISAHAKKTTDAVERRIFFSFYFWTHSRTTLIGEKRYFFRITK